MKTHLHNRVTAHKPIDTLQSRSTLLKPLYLFSCLLVMSLLLLPFSGQAAITSITLTRTSAATVNPGGIVTYTFRITTNSNQNNVAAKIQFSGSELPASVTSSSSGNFPATTNSYNAGTGLLTIGTERINNTTVNFTITATLPNPADAGTLSAVGSTTNPVATSTAATVTINNVPPTITSFTPTNGSTLGGTTVTVNGNNFTNSSLSATVAGTAATSVTYVSATQITLVTPAGANGTAGKITVTTAGGTATSSQNFTYVAPPTITNISPPAGPVGQVITVTGTSLSTVAQVTFNGAAGTADDQIVTPNTGGTNTSFTITVPAGAVTGTITVTADGGSITSAQIFTVVPPLAIASFAPMRNALVAARNTSVAVTYNQPVTTASASDIRIFSAQRGGLVTATTSVSGNTATLKPGFFFKAGEVVSVTVPRTVVDSYGQETSNPQVYQFTTATENGTGVFTSIADLVTGTNPSNQALADFDGDNKLDLAAANYGNGTGNTVSISRYTGGSGTPSLAAKQDFIITGQQGIYNIAAGDFNNDGKIDLVTANNASNSISILRNTNTTPGSITASSFAASVSLAVGTGPTTVAVGDIDGDGYLDIVTSNQGTTTVSVLRNTTTGTTITFAAAQTYQVGAGTRPYGLTINDIDGDGKLDLITANSGTNTASVLRNNTTGIGALTASSFSAATSFAVGTGPYAVVAGDLNADGLLDLVTVNNTANSISILRNTTTGAGQAFTFAAKQDITVGTLPVGLAIGDINSDGKLDIVASDYGSSGSTGTGTTVSLLQNTTTATTISMAALRTVTVGNGPNSVALGDLDGDGDLDIVTANQGGDNNTASIRINNTSQAPLPLPVSLIQFTAVAAGNGVRLSWSTATEFNNAYFEVERSLDAATFVPVGRVAGSGNSSQNQQYSLLDNAVQGNVLYYRLRQVDLDATAHYSEVRMVKLHDATGLTLRPNPASGAVSVDLTTLPAAPYTIQVMDMMGRTVSTQQVIGGRQVMIEASRALYPGIYFVSINGTNLNVTQRLVKE